jgi:hypothetical protein
MPARALAVLIGLLALIGCAAPPSPSASADGGEEPAADVCPQIVLRSPSGVPIQLTDRWRSPDGGTYYVRQVDSCVWFAGFSGDTGAPGGEGASDWTNTFFGHISADFTLHGDWADIPWGNDTGVGYLDWRVTFADVEGEEAITLEVTDASGLFGAGLLVKPETRVDLAVRLRNDQECDSVVANDGVEYQILTLPNEWGFTTPPGLLGPDGENFTPSDSFEITGEVARGVGFCGPGHLLFADDIQAIPSP